MKEEGRESIVKSLPSLCHRGLGVGTATVEVSEFGEQAGALPTVTHFVGRENIVLGMSPFALSFTGERFDVIEVKTCWTSFDGWIDGFPANVASVTIGVKDSFVVYLANSGFFLTGYAPHPNFIDFLRMLFGILLRVCTLIFLLFTSQTSSTIKLPAFWRLVVSTTIRIGQFTASWGTLPSSDVGAIVLFITGTRIIFTKPRLIFRRFLALLDVLYYPCTPTFFAVAFFDIKIPCGFFLATFRADFWRCIFTELLFFYESKLCPPLCIVANFARIRVSIFCVRALREISERLCFSALCTYFGRCIGKREQGKLYSACLHSMV